ncbi:MAG: hypothetical protein KAT11_08500, partial [Phycisphaerae bacterium]|nr:hypothetical protein [Phycisphaerae bacterium]
DITKAASDSKLCGMLAKLYREVEEQLGQLELVCRRCGKCCRFGEFGQELLASTAEVGYLWAWLRKQPSKLNRLLAGKTEWSHKVCPFLEDESCTAREARALGCRAFFCQAEGSKKEQMENIYEGFHKRIGELHKQRDVSYHYLGWAEAMSAVRSFVGGS